MSRGSGRSKDELWSAIRQFFAAWMGMTVGLLTAATGFAYREELLGQWLEQVRVDPWKIPLATGVILGISAIVTICVMMGYHEEDESARRVRQSVRPRNYFFRGLMLAVFLSLMFAAFAGIGIDTSQLLGWVGGGQ